MFSFKELTKEFPQQTVKTSDGHLSVCCSQQDPHLSLAWPCLPSFHCKCCQRRGCNPSPAATLISSWGHRPASPHSKLRSGQSSIKAQKRHSPKGQAGPDKEACEKERSHMRGHITRDFREQISRQAGLRVTSCWAAQGHQGGNSSLMKLGRAEGNGQHPVKGIKSLPSFRQ